MGVPGTVGAARAKVDVWAHGAHVADTHDRVTTHEARDALVNDLAGVLFDQRCARGNTTVSSRTCTRTRTSTRTGASMAVTAAMTLALALAVLAAVRRRAGLGLRRRGRRRATSGILAVRRRCLGEWCQLGGACTACVTVLAKDLRSRGLGVAGAAGGRSDAVWSEVCGEVTGVPKYNVEPGECTRVGEGVVVQGERQWMYTR